MNDNSISNMLKKHGVVSWAESLEGLNDAEKKRFYIILDKTNKIESSSLYLVYSFLLTLISVFAVVSIYISPSNNYREYIGISFLYSLLPLLITTSIIPDWLKKKQKKDYQNMRNFNN